ncbi:MAG TPA: hypothetical protein PLZ51_09600, partial [Aggregatilineales bacterium]|nr:hypothetical protein [Aggregatilineales bacterium]
TELGGDGETATFGPFNCTAPTVTLVASATCNGAALDVTITAGDGNFDIEADSTLLVGGVGTGLTSVSGPHNITTLTVTELGGDGETATFGPFNCIPGPALAFTAVCDGATLDVTITNGEAPFSIDVMTVASGTFSASNQPFGTYSYTGPETFTVVVGEESGDLETLPLVGVTCTAPVVPVVPVVPVAPVVLSPDLTAQGCVFTTNIEAPNAPDNTYCRMLMQDGAVVNYAGAIPAELIGLGVKLAVDVYRL